MAINYNHSKNAHSTHGPEVALPLILDQIPNSLLDVGCGTGTWMRSAKKLGVPIVFGVDGICPEERFYGDNEFQKIDFRAPWKLNERYEVALCLEVAEHIEKEYAEQFIQNIVAHADKIYFSAACPGQIGDHHVNCQWPQYWQKVFNKYGFVCSDKVRWKIWNASEVEPWYRQNLFIAEKNGIEAGKEARLNSIINPAMLDLLFLEERKKLIIETTRQIEFGSMPLPWYFKNLATSILCKSIRAFQKNKNGH
jgi:hypothetical protein